MMSPRLRKVWGDVRENPARALLVALAIAVSTAALMAAVSAQVVLDREIQRSFLSGNPPHAVLWLESADQTLAARVEEQPGVAAAEARRVVRTRAEVAPGDWRSLLIFVVPDFDSLRVSTFRSERGAWPPETGSALAEGSALPVLNLDVGEALRLRVPGGEVAELQISGIVHDPGVAPGWQDNVGYIYVTSETLAGLSVEPQLDELRVLAPEESSREEATELAAALTTWLAGQGREVQRIEVPVREHPHADHMATLVLLLQLFSAATLVFSGTLVANLMAGTLARQVRQVGIMKAVGATSGQVIALYFAFVFFVAAVAVAAGLPLGALLARVFAGFATGQLNLGASSFAVPAWVFLIVALVGLGWPLLAAAGPVVRAARRSVREAVQDSGLRPYTGRAWVRSFSLIPADRVLTLAFRNSLRRPWRTGLTLVALALGGAMLMTTANVYRGLLLAVDTSLATRSDDIDLRLLGLAPTEPLLERARAVPGVVEAEAWGHVLATVELEDAGERVGTGRYSVLAPPADTKLFDPVVAEGRWPQPDEQGAVVVSHNLQAAEPGLELGARRNLVVAGRATPVEVVGVMDDVSPPGFYTNAATMMALLGQEEVSGALRVRTVPGEEMRVATALEEQIISAGWFPSFLMTVATLRSSMVDHFLILLILLSVIAALSLLVGGLGLATSMSLNVLERTREIGVTRALGASRGTVRRVVLLEGASIATVSVLLAMLLSLPLTVLAAFLVGEHGLHVEVPVVVVPAAVSIWIVLATVLTVLACWWPARQATQLPVRETLAFE